MNRGTSPSRRAGLAALAAAFLKLGAIGFGGPAAHIALMEEELVRRRAWLTREELLDLVGAANLIPGPNSTEVAIHVGYRRGGWPGLFVAGLGFILPAAASVLALSWAYVRFREIPLTGALLYGVKPVVLAIVLAALWRFARSALKSRLLAATALAAVAACALRVNELLVLTLAGALCAAPELRRRARGGIAAPALAAAGGAGALATAVRTAAGGIPFSLGTLFLVFLKIGAVLFGSGYVLLAFLRADLVERLHWITPGELLDAVVVGQITPGPLFTSATFIGYLLAGTPGAAVATAGIFLPAFAYVAASGPLIPRLRRSPPAGAFLDGVVAASLALMAVVAWQLAAAAVSDIPTLALALVSLLCITRLGVNASWLVLGGAAAGLLLQLAGRHPLPSGA